MVHKEVNDIMKYNHFEFRHQLYFRSLCNCVSTYLLIHYYQPTIETTGENCYKPITIVK